MDRQIKKIPRPTRNDYKRQHEIALLHIWIDEHVDVAIQRIIQKHPERAREFLARLKAATV